MEDYMSFARKITKAFQQAGLDYAFTGALAISFYGSPRTTTDVDVIVAVVSGSDVKVKIAMALQAAGLIVDERKTDSALTSGYRIATFKDKKPLSHYMLFSQTKN